MKIIGIDPGLSGAIAVLEDNKVLGIYDMPVMADGKKSKRQLNSAQLVNIIKQNVSNNDELAIIVEQVNAMLKEVPGIKLSTRRRIRAALRSHYAVLDGVEAGGGAEE